MKLSDLRIQGRFENLETGKRVNIHKGWDRQSGRKVYFYYYRMKRIYICETDFVSETTWKEVFEK
jgi:hypothetical protein